MFEASFTNRLDVLCHEHHSPVIKICTDVECSLNPFLCHECLSSFSNQQKHYGHQLQIKDTLPAIQQIAHKINKTRKPVAIIFNQMQSDKQNHLMKYQEQKQQHCESIRKHIESIKFSLEQEIGVVLRVFEKQLNLEKENMYKQLERYYRVYQEKFEYFSKKIGPVVAINKSLKYYANKNNMILKIMSDSDPSTKTKWLNEVKRAAKASEKLVADPSSEMSKIRMISQTMNELMDQLPCFKNAQLSPHFAKIVQSSARQIISNLVRFGEPKSHCTSSSIQRSNSVIDTKNTTHDYSQTVIKI